MFRTFERLFFCRLFKVGWLGTRFAVRIGNLMAFLAENARIGQVVAISAVNVVYFEFLSSCASDGLIGSPAFLTRVSLQFNNLHGGVP